MNVRKRMSVGIFFNARPEQGGLYHYALTLVDCLKQYVPQYDYRLYHATLEKLPIKIEGANWQAVALPRRDIGARMAIELLLMSAVRVGLDISLQMIPEFPAIRRNPPRIMIYAKPTPHVFQWNYLSIFPIHDLQHKFQPEFPEVSQRGEYRRREYIYTRSLPKAAAILTDSETGKEDVLACYGGDEKRIFALPYIAPTYHANLTDAATLSSVRKKYNLPDQYLFYPAAFWPHKNHSRLLQAINLLAREGGVRIPLVLSGSKNRNYERVAALVDKLGLSDLVRFTGYVPDDDLAALYRQSLALVMPTFFGPTNIPILEAWAAGCPVVTSDLRGIREQVGDAGLLVDPRDEVELAAAILRLYQSPKMRQDLIERGRTRAAQWTPELFALRLAKVIDFAAAQQ